MKSSVSAASRSGEPSRTSASQLKKRIEAKELKPGSPEDLRARHAGEARFHRAFRHRVAVVTRISQKLPAAPEQREVDAPGVDAEAVNSAGLRGGLAKSIEHVFVEAKHVPMECVEDSDRAVGETVNGLQLEPAAVEQPENGSPALCTKIKGEQFSGCRHEPPCG